MSFKYQILNACKLEKIALESLQLADLKRMAAGSLVSGASKRRPRVSAKRRFKNFRRKNLDLLIVTDADV